MSDEKRSDHGTWIGTNLKAACPACGTHPLALQQRLGVQPAQVRLPLHSSTLTPCPGSYQEVLLVLQQDVVDVASDSAVTSDQRVEEWWSGRRQGGIRIAERAAALLKLVLALLVVLVPRLALAAPDIGGGWVVSVLGLELIAVGCALGLLVVGALAGIWLVARRYAVASPWVSVSHEVGGWRAVQGRWNTAEARLEWLHDKAIPRRWWWQALHDAWRLSRPVAGLLLLATLSGCDDSSAAVHRGLDWLLLVGCGVFGGLWAHVRDRVQDLERVRDVLQGEVVFARREAQTAHLRADAAESVLQVMAGRAGGVQ